MMFWVGRYAPCFIYPDFRRFWAGCMLATIAYHMQGIVLAWEMLLATDSAFWVGLVAFAYGLPFLVLSPITGVLADRLRRQRVMMLALLVAALSSFGLAGVAAFGTVTRWHILLVSFLLGSSFVLYAPARSALLPNLIPPEILLNASTLTYSTTRLLGFVGTALAGLLLEFAGIGPALIIQAIIYVLAIPIFERTGFRVTHPVRNEHHSGYIFRALQEVVIYLRREQPSLLALAFLSLVVVSIFTSFEKLLPIFTRDVLAAGPSTLGLIASLLHLGISMTGLVIAGYGRGWFRGSFVLMSSAMFGVGLAIFALVRQVELAILWSVLLGVIIGIYLTLTNVLFESRPLDEVRGRVQSMWGMVWGLAPFVNLAAGAAAEQWGVTVAIASGGLICAMFCAWMLLSSSDLRDL